MVLFRWIHNIQSSDLDRYNISNAKIFGGREVNFVQEFWSWFLKEMERNMHAIRWNCLKCGIGYFCAVYIFICYYLCLWRKDVVCVSWLPARQATRQFLLVLRLNTRVRFHLFSSHSFCFPDLFNLVSLESKVQDQLHCVTSLMPLLKYFRHTILEPEQPRLSAQPNR